MGSSKTANALMQYFEATSKGRNVLLLKPAVDNRDGNNIIKSRIGLMQAAINFYDDTNLIELIKQYRDKIDLIIVDESQFCKEHHVDELKCISIYMNIPVYAYGLKNNFQSKLFEGSKRFIELADDLRELEMSCEFCGRPAEVNARFDKKGKVISEGEVIVIGGNDKYKALCYKCWHDKIELNKKNKN